MAVISATFWTWAIGVVLVYIPLICLAVIFCMAAGQADEDLETMAANRHAVEAEFNLDMRPVQYN